MFGGILVDCASGDHSMLYTFGDSAIPYRSERKNKNLGTDEFGNEGSASCGGLVQLGSSGWWPGSRTGIQHPGAMLRQSRQGS